jgi:prepilin-type N-terminal cleavage/methylation domain-containing protein
LKRRGFTLVEVMVVVVIIGLIAAIGLPAFRRVNLRSKATAVANDLRQFSGVFSTYSLQNGRWPADNDPQVIPPEVAGSLPENFARVTPAGGVYEWNHDVAAHGVYARASIAMVTANGFTLTDDAELAELIDTMIDDGNLETGNFQLGAGNNFVYIIEP